MIRNEFGEIEPDNGGTLSLPEILDEFGRDDTVFPDEALRQAVARWEEVGDILLDHVRAFADGRDRSDRNMNIAYLSVFVAGSARDKRVLPLLYAMDDAENTLQTLLQESITNDLTMLFIRLHDGDLAALKAVIENERGNEFARDAAIGTLAWLTHKGELDRAETHDYLRGLYDTMRPHDVGAIWYAWGMAIARLGFDDLVPLVEDAYAKEWPGEYADDIEGFYIALKTGMAGGDDSSFDAMEKDDGRLDDIVSFFNIDPWGLSESEDDESFEDTLPPLDLSWLTSSAPAEPHRNPNRNVGRNDPCPCGSGKKYKKCCLNAG